MTRVLCIKNNALFLLPILTVVLSATIIAGMKTVLVTTVLYFLFLLPGFLFFKINKFSILRSIIYGMPLGFSITSLLIITFVGTNGWNLSSLSIIYLSSLFFTACCAVLTSRSGKLDLPETNHHWQEVHRVPFYIFIMISLSVIIISGPFESLGKLTGNGYAFSGLFSHDFILRSISSVSLAGNIPADNFYFHGQKMSNYYILWYVLPATTYNLIRAHGNMHYIISTICLLNIPFFYLFIYFVLIDFLEVKGISRYYDYDNGRVALIFILILFCYSYHWIFVALKWVVSFFGIEILKYYTAQMNLLSQSWIRDIIFEPQLVLCMTMILLLLRIMSMRPSVLRGILIGIILGATALTDTTLFFLVGIAYFMYYGVVLVRHKNLELGIDVFSTCLLGLLIAALMYSVGVIKFTQYSKKIVFEPYLLAIAGFPLLLILEFGVIPVAGIMGLGKRAKDQKSVFMIFILLICIFFMLFLTENMEGNVFLRKSLQLFRLPLCLFLGYYFYYSRPDRIYKLMVALCIFAAPTLFTDIYSLVDVTNKRYTTYITKGEMEAARWLKEKTPRDRVVQGRIEYPGYFNYSLTICFGERRASLGLWKIAYLTYPNPSALKGRGSEIDKMFSRGNCAETLRIVRKLKINYVFIGEKERDHYPGCEAKFASDRENYRKVFSNGEVNIYEVLYKKKVKNKDDFRVSLLISERMHSDTFYFSQASLTNISQTPHFA